MEAKTARLVVPMTPVAQPRPRFASFGSKVAAYTPRRHKVHAFRESISLMAKTSGFFSEVAVEVRVLFVMPNTKSRQAGWHVSRPDLDNLVKAVLDGLSCCWKEDSQVASLQAAKIIGNDPRCVIDLFEMSENPHNIFQKGD